MMVIAVMILDDVNGSHTYDDRDDSDDDNDHRTLQHIAGH